MKKKLPFILIVSLFFLWAFIHNINPILIPHLKKACELTDLQSALIDFVVYFAYFIMAIPAGIFMSKYGYKKGILLGLFLFSLGTYMFVPASMVLSFDFFLLALFIIASGITFLETIANPYVTQLGDKKTASVRLSFAQSFNGMGAFLAPILGGKFILTGVEYSKEQLNSLSEEAKRNYLVEQAHTIQIPYLIFGSVILIIFFIFYNTTLAEPIVNKIEKENTPSLSTSSFSLRVFKHKHFLFAVITLFVYVGIQVGVSSFFIRFAKQVNNLNEKTAAIYLGYAMIGFMAGRFLGTFLMRFITASRLLLYYSIIGMILLFIAVIYKGNMAIYAVLLTPFFMSIMFPTIFSLGLQGLETEIKSASSFLIMSIVGGALLPLLMGWVSDKTHTMQFAYIIPMVGFMVVALFAWKSCNLRN